MPILLLFLGAVESLLQSVIPRAGNQCRFCYKGWMDRPWELGLNPYGINWISAAEAFVDWISDGVVRH